MEEQVVIHAPDHSEAGAVGAGGRHVLKTYKRSDTKFQPLVFTAVIGFVLVALLIALVIRSSGPPEFWLKALGAIMLGPPLAWAGYTFLRDPELEAHHGAPLIIRSLACGLVYALLWGCLSFLGDRFFGDDALKKGLEIWQMIVLILPSLLQPVLSPPMHRSISIRAVRFFIARCTSPSPYCCDWWPPSPPCPASAAARRMDNPVRPQPSRTCSPI